MTADSYDVIIVGARCAGSPLATLLARRGLHVGVVERATFPRDTLSTHIFQAQALAFLARLGVIEKIRATGAPFVNNLDLRQGDFHVRTPVPLQPGDVGGIASVRRMVLDPILAEAAAEAGAEIRMGATVTELEREGGRVCGVRVRQNGTESVLRARLVVGADGRNSTVAELAGARKYNVTPNQRFGYWSFFEGADLGPEPTAVFHRWSDRLLLGCPCDSGLYEVAMMPDLADLPRFRADREGAFLEHARSSAPIAAALSGARRVGKIFGMLRFEGFFREASGPGWVLAGDAGHFKDPAPGQGIQDAFRQVDALDAAIARGLGGEDLDGSMSEWGRWRDNDAFEHYWFAVDTGKGGVLPSVVSAFSASLYARGELDSLVNILNHRMKPSQVVTPPRILGITARLLARRGADRRAVLREVRGLVTEGMQRRRLARRPQFAPPDASRDAGETEVEEAVAA